MHMCIYIYIYIYIYTYIQYIAQYIAHIFIYKQKSPLYSVISLHQSIFEHKSVSCMYNPSDLEFQRKPGPKHLGHKSNTKLSFHSP